MFLPKGFKTVLILSALFVLANLFPGCQSGESKTEPVKSEQIGVIVADGQDENAQIMRKTMVNRIKKDGVKLTWLDSANDEAKQEENIKALLERKVDVAVIQPLEADAAADLVRQLKQEQVKVITLEKMPPNTPLDGHIMPDYTNAGSLQAQFILDTLALDRTPAGNGNGEGTLVKTSERPLNSKVLLMCGPEGDKISEEILAANLSLLETNPHLDLTVREIPDGNDGLIKSKTIEYLTGEGETPGFVLTNEARAGKAVLEFIQENALDNRMITVGLGGGKNTALALAAGEHNAEVDMMPEVTANQAYDAAMAMAMDEHWPYDRLENSGDYQVPLRLTPVRLIKSDNVFLLEERWGALTKHKTDHSEEKEPAAGKKEDSGGGGSQDGEDSGSSGGGQGKMTTTVKIETTEGKTYEMEIDGVVRSIESSQKGDK